MQCSPRVVEVQGSRWHYATDSGECLQIREKNEEALDSERKTGSQRTSPPTALL